MTICLKCGNELEEKTLVFCEGNCWRCNKKMKIGKMLGRAGYTIEFSPDDILLASKYGIFLKLQYSKTLEDSYIANTCPNCKAFIGQHYYHEYFYCSENFHQIEAGHYCDFCYYDDQDDEEIFE